MHRLGPWVLVSLAVLFGLVALRAELSPAQNLNDGSVHRRDAPIWSVGSRLARGAVRPCRAPRRALTGAEPERRCGPPLDDRVGQGSVVRRPSAARRMVPTAGARLVPVSPLPEPAARVDGATRDRRRLAPRVHDHAVSRSRAVADRGVRRWTTPRSRAMAFGRRCARLAAHYERTDARVRVGELRVAWVRHVDAAVGDVAAAIRMGIRLPRGGSGAFVRSCGARGRDHRRGPPSHGVPRAVVARGARTRSADAIREADHSRRIRRDRCVPHRGMGRRAVTPRSGDDDPGRVLAGKGVLRLVRRAADPVVDGHRPVVRS